VSFVVGVESQRLGRSLSTRPEGSTVRIYVVQGEVVEQLKRSVVVSLLELSAGPHDAVIEGLGAVEQAALKSLEGRQFHDRAQSVQVAGLLQEVGNNLGVLSEAAFEQVFSGPLQAVLNVVGERVQQADGSLLCWGIARSTVAFSHARDDNLNITLGTQSARLQERLPVRADALIRQLTIKFFVHVLEEDAAAIDVETSLHVVQGVGNTVQVGPEFVVQHVFSGRLDLYGPGLNVHVRVHLLNGLSSSGRFEFLINNGISIA
jgi:hypothetical protein